MTLRSHHAALLASLAVITLSSAARGQDTTSFTGGVHAIGLITHGTGTPRGRSLTEAYLTQPILSADAHVGRLHALGMLNLEGITLRRGELDLGAWGEGYVDRRHSHAYAHELMAGVDARRDVFTSSLYAGRGFVPFGSDDPMTRPFVSYPVDHHLAQILERAVVVAAARTGPLIVEAAAFDGDEPLDPATPPLFRRFGDSWSVRGTIVGDHWPSIGSGAEISASYANVKSPEYREGHGLDQRKAHAAIRLSGASSALSRYALVEVARTTDVDRGRSLYTFDALLGEVAVCHGALGIAARWERSDRPEEERLLDLFRSPRPATDLSILGVTQWTTLSAAVSLPGVNAYDAHAAPFVEAARLRADRTTAALFDPGLFYGSNLMWRLSAGIRVGAGHEHGRMGRYGVASETPKTTPANGHQHISTTHCFS
jgi:hypothetical protein